MYITPYFNSEVILSAKVKKIFRATFAMLRRLFSKMEDLPLLAIVAVPILFETILMKLHWNWTNNVMSQVESVVVWEGAMAGANILAHFTHGLISKKL